MKFWQALTWVEPEQLIETARFAEAVGFDGCMLGDHGVYPRDIAAGYPYATDGVPPMRADADYPDCWATIGALAAATKKLRFTVSVYVLPLRNVFEVARATGTLAILSNDRFALGAGIGWMKEEFDIYGVDFKTRGKRTDEMIEVLRKLWAGGMVEHHGRFFDFPALQIAPAPKKTVPIWMGGASEPALRRTATLCDGWLGAGNDPAKTSPGILDAIAKLRARGRRSRAPALRDRDRTRGGPRRRDTFQRLAGARHAPSASATRSGTHSASARASTRRSASWKTSRRRSSGAAPEPRRSRALRAANRFSAAHEESPDGRRPLDVGLPGKAREIARRTEAAGFSHLALGDTQNLGPETWSQLMLVAGASTRIRIGTGVTNTTTRDVALTASAALALQLESGGRAFCGIGRGDSALAKIGRKPAAPDVFEADLAHLRAYLAGESTPADRRRAASNGLGGSTSRAFRSRSRSRARRCSRSRRARPTPSSSASAPTRRPSSGR
jgi:probable F420-dependent oxidoreductase